MIGDFTAKKQVKLVTDTKRMNNDTSLEFRRQVYEMNDMIENSQLAAGLGSVTIILGIAAWYNPKCQESRISVK